MKSRTDLALACLIAAITVFPGVTHAKQQRSQAAKDAFKREHPCPANGKRYGPCPGYVIDHITPLACGGADAPSNMQWQTQAEAKAKDKWERKGCSSHENRTGSMSSFDGQPYGYLNGPRGGCFTVFPNGTKRYVDHSFCGRL